MQQIKIEATLSEKLAALKGEVIFVDEQGRALGFFLRLTARRTLMSCS